MNPGNFLDLEETTQKNQTLGIERIHGLRVTLSQCYWPFRASSSILVH